MPLTNEYFEANFGSAYSGLAGTVGYQLRDAAGAAVGGRVTAGITEPDAGSGVYRITVANVADNVASIVWDTSGGAPVFTSEDVGPFHDRAAILADTSTMEPIVSTNLDALVSSRAIPGDAMNLVADAVDAAAIATDAIDADALAASATAEIDSVLSAAHGAGQWDVAAVAGAVWDELEKDHLTTGTMGASLLRARSSPAFMVPLSVDPAFAVPLSVDPAFHVELGDE